MTINLKNAHLRLFCVAYFLLFLYSMLGHIEVLDGYLQIFSWFSFLIFVLLGIAFNHKISPTKLLAIITVFVIGFMVAFNSKDYFILKFAIICLAARGLELETIFKFDFKLRITIFFVIIALYFYGIANDVVSVYSDGSVRRSWGFQNPNHLGLLIFICVLELLYVRRFIFSLKEIFFVVAIVFIIESFLGCRTAVISLLAVFILLLLLNYIPTLIDQKWFQGFMRTLYLFITIGIFLLMMLYNAGSPFAVAINDMTSNRLYNISFFYNLLGISFFGDDSSIGFKTLDTFYAYIFIVCGLICFAFIGIVIDLLFKYIFRKRDRVLCVVLFGFLIFGFGERLWMCIDYNIMLLMFGTVLFSNPKIS